MATFVTIEPDAFNREFRDVATERAVSSGLEINGKKAPSDYYHHVRRPVRGIQIKEDTYATIQVRQANGIAIPLFDAGSPANTGKGIKNSNFLINSIQEARAEKQQVILTFGEPYIFFFGEQPRIITVTGTLLNTEDFNWRAEWWENYHRYLRGTQCVRSKSRVYLSWDDIVVEGYISQSQAAESSDAPYYVQFSFQMFLTNYQNISSIGDINAHWQGKDIDLDPSSISLPGTGENSTTIAVRSENVVQAQLAAGQSKNSLFEFLRSGQFGDASTRLVQMQGQLVDFLSLAGQFVSGRNIRVPVGFEGAAAFDQEVQVALASFPGNFSSLSQSRTLSIKTASSLVPGFRATLGSKFGPANVGLPLSANSDEYIARVQQDETGAHKFNQLFAGQAIEDDAAIDKVKEVYDEFGIKTEPPSELTLFFRKQMFGIVALGAGMNVADSSKLRSSLNAIGTVL